MVTIDGGVTQTAPNGSAIELSASADGGSPPYTIRWLQERGPEAVLESQTGATVTTDAATTQGDYVFRVVVTDAEGVRSDRWVTVTVDRGPFRVTIEGLETVEFGAIATLTAVAPSEGEVTVEWSVLEGSAALDPTDELIVQVADAELGGVRVRVEASEGDTGESDDDEFAFTVVPAVSLDAPNVTFAGVAEAFAATVDPVVEGTSYAWSVTSGRGAFDDPSSPSPLFTAAGGGDIAYELRVTVPLEDGSSVEGTAAGTIVALEDAVVISTNLGDITLELDEASAPVTRNNFIAYVEEGFYDGVLIHRYSCEIHLTNECADEPDTCECVPFVIQGGGFVRVEGGLEPKEATRDPIRSEADNGLSNVKYTVAMALSANDVDSATTQFYVNMNENTHLDGLFTVFGRVVDGFEVLDAVSRIETGTAEVLDPETGEVTGELDEVPVEDVVMESVRRVEGTMANGE
ncbi:MAG: hypothetical protein C4547_10095 [Phycisphaerales bacterium]|nr:MAG: hypothetical protein C4547_10095 [Phycisphaerales bacterium]